MLRASFLALSLPLFASPAFAAEPAAATASALPSESATKAAGDQDSLIHAVNDREPAPALVPAATDLLSRHLLIGVSAAAAWTFGRLASRRTAPDALGTGVRGEVDLGFGVSRSISLGVWGSYAAYRDGNDCPDCSAHALGVGPFLRYHLVQGMRLDPWLLLGAGYHSLDLDLPNDAGKYRGVEWVRFQLGADYYASSSTAVGPFGSLSIRSYPTRPEGSGGARASTELAVGLRLRFDVPGR